MHKIDTAHKRIIIAVDTYPPDINGSAHFSYRLAQGLVERDYEVHVIAPADKKGKTYSLKTNGITEHRLHSHKVLTHTSYRVCFPWEIKKDMAPLFALIKPNVVHVQCHYLVGRVVAKFAVQQDIRLIATNHFIPECLSPYLPLPKWIRKKIEDYSWRDIGNVFKQANTVTTPTPSAAEVLRKFTGLSNVMAISNGIDTKRFQLLPNEQITQLENPTVLFVGRLDPDKCIDVLLDAIALTPKPLNINLMIIGDGIIRQQLEKKARCLNITERVCFLGHVSEQQLRYAYLSATVFCMPGTVELQSIASLEAMAASRPVILANAMALPHLVKNNKNGYLFAPGDSVDLAHKITEIIQLSDSKRMEMGRESLEIAKEHNINETLNDFEKLYFPSSNLMFDDTDVRLKK